MAGVVTNNNNAATTNTLTSSTPLHSEKGNNEGNSDIDEAVIDKEWMDLSSSWFKSIDLNSIGDRLVFKSNYVFTLDEKSNTKTNTNASNAIIMENDSYKPIEQPEDAYVWIHWTTAQGHKHSHGLNTSPDLKLKSESAGVSIADEKKEGDVHHAVVQSNSDLLRRQVRYALSQCY